MQLLHPGHKAAVLTERLVNQLGQTNGAVIPRDIETFLHIINCQMIVYRLKLVYTLTDIGKPYKAPLRSMAMSSSCVAQSLAYVMHAPVELGLWC